MAEESETISRCGISGFFNDVGHPAALASGWLEVVDSKKRKTPQYFVMTPIHLAFFRREDHAAIDPDGFMAGDADHDQVSFWRNHGASIRLVHVARVELTSPEAKSFAIVMREDCRLWDGTSAMILEAANADIANGWVEALAAQIVKAGSIYAPVRVGALNLTQVDDDGGGASGLLSALGSMLSMGGSSASSAPVMADDEYFFYAPWEDMDIDLLDASQELYLYNEAGAPAAVLHGWLTKLNKTGVRAGADGTGKDRYFVLTPDSLAFFPDPGSARVEGGYVYGAVDGTKVKAMFGKTGGRLSLESIVEIRPGKDASAMSAVDEEDDDDDVPAKKKAADDDRDGDAPKSKAVTSAATRTKPTKEKNREPWFSVDFAEFVLTLNAHNLKNRNAWIRRLRAWTAWRKQVVDKELLKSMARDF